MRKQIFFLLIYLSFGLYAYSSQAYKQSISVETSLNNFMFSVPIDSLFTGECLSCSGQKILLDIKDKLGDNEVFIECSTNRKLCYNASWELADIYAYQVVIFLIKSGMNPRKITYIGYGSMSVADKEPNRIVFSIIK